MSKKVTAHNYSIDSIMTFFKKHPPHTELGKLYFKPILCIKDMAYVLKYYTNRRNFIEDYQIMIKSSEEDEISPYIIHIPTKTVYCLPRYGKLQTCEELMLIAIEMGEMKKCKIIEVPEGCEYWIDWEREYVDIIYPYKTTINELLEIIRLTGIPDTINTSKYHRYTQILLESVASK